MFVETLFNVIMPLSLKFLIDDALGERIRALVESGRCWWSRALSPRSLRVLYERWDAKLAASLNSDVRVRLFEHVQNLPSPYFARTRRAEKLSRFSIDLSVFEDRCASVSPTARRCRFWN